MTEAKEKARKFVKYLEKSGVKVNKAYLFGSHAKGKAKKDSDIDVCIVSPSFSRDYFSEMVRLRKYALKVDSRIEPVPFLPGDLEDRYSTLAKEIKKYGIPL